jgi:hypothetical protein
MTRRFYVADDAWNGYEVREPDPAGGHTVATHVSRYGDAVLLASAPIMADALAELLHELDPLGVAAPDSARCKLCGIHPATHALDCVVLDAREALDIARGRR